MQKLIYILPEYNLKTDTHFYYNYELLERIRGRVKLFLIVERGSRPKGFYGYRQIFRWAPLRGLELFVLIGVLRLCGYKTTWTHYSFFGAILAPFFTKSFYWNCGMPWLYTRGRTEEYFFQLALRRSMLVTGTEGMKSMYTSKYHLKQKKAYVLPNWINIQRFEHWRGRREEARHKLGIARSAKVVLFIHHLSKRKGANMLMPTAQYFDNDTDVLFLVAGQGPLEAAIHGGNIRKEGAVPQADIPLYLAAADVFFMPSEEEGFPHVLLEAMAMELPIVASDVGGVSEIVPPEAKEYVLPQNATAFAEKIQFLLDDPARARVVAQAGKRWVEKFSIEKIQENFLELIGR